MVKKFEPNEQEFWKYYHQGKAADYIKLILEAEGKIVRTGWLTKRTLKLAKDMGKDPREYEALHFMRAAKMQAMAMLRDRKKEDESHVRPQERFDNFNVACSNLKGISDLAEECLASANTSNWAKNRLDAEYLDLTTKVDCKDVIEKMIPFNISETRFKALTEYIVENLGEGVASMNKVVEQLLERVSLGWLNIKKIAEVSGKDYPMEKVDTELLNYTLKLCDVKGIDLEVVPNWVNKKLLHGKKIGTPSKQWIQEEIDKLANKEAPTKKSGKENSSDNHNHGDNSPIA